MKASVFLTHEQKVEMATMYVNGASIRACAQAFHVHTSTAHKWIKDAGINMRPMSIAKRRYTCDEHVFGQLNSEASYWLGFLLADGCLSQRPKQALTLSVALGEKDLQQLEALKTFLKATHPKGILYEATLMQMAVSLSMRKPTAKPIFLL
jgi:DNA-binding transcriptional regulator WhiA